MSNWPTREVSFALLGFSIARMIDGHSDWLIAVTVALALIGILLTRKS